MEKANPDFRIIFNHRRVSLLLPILLLFAFGLVVGSTYLGPEYSEIAIISISFGLVLYIFRKNIIELLLLFTLLIFIFSQFLNPTVLALRWVALSGTILLLFLTQKWVIKFTPIIILFLVVSGYAIYRSYYSPYPIISFLKGISIILFSVYLSLVIPTLGNKITRYELIRKILNIYLIVAIIVIVSLAIFYIISPDQSILAGRFRGWFVNPNGIGATFGILFIPILFYELLKKRSDKKRAVLLIIFIFAVLELLFSQSRAGVISAACAILILCLLRKRILLPITVVCAITILFLFLYQPQDNIIMKFIVRDETTVGIIRLNTWSDLIQEISKNPLFGIGFGVSDIETNGTNTIFSATGYTIEKTNSYLAAIDELGFLGFIPVLIILIIVLSKCFKIILHFDEKQNSLLLLLAAMIIAGLVNAIFEAWLLAIGSVIAFSFWIFAYLITLPDEYVRNR